MGTHDRWLMPSPTLVREELARTYERARLLRRLLKLSEDAAIQRHGRPIADRPHRNPQPEAARPEGVAVG